MEYFFYIVINKSHHSICLNWEFPNLKHPKISIPLVTAVTSYIVKINEINYIAKYHFDLETHNFKICQISIFLFYIKWS